LNILHYVDENNLAWARPWLQLIKYLEDKGLQNHILCRPGGSLDNYVLENKIGLSTYKPLISSLPHLCRGISTIIKATKPDIIHTRLSSAAMIGGYWGKRMGVPVVSTIDKYPKNKYYLDSDKLIPCSSAVASHMQSVGFLKSDMELIYNPVDIDEYRKDFPQREDFRRKHNIGEDEFIILGAGRFVDWKGFDTLIKACSTIRKMENIEKNWKLWLVGDGPEMSIYEKCVSDFKMGDKTIFWGFQSNIKQFLWVADLFVQPSREPEGFSLMLLEAMAAGLPAIATDIGGTLDIIDDDLSGWLFKPDDVQKLSSILHKILLKDSLYDYSFSAQTKAENFSVAKIGEQTIRFYEDVLRERHNVGR
jgi:glycosyltransferase involved in cell wall biosynthesis